MKHPVISICIVASLAACDTTTPILPDSLRVDTVLVTPGSAILYEGDSARFQATARDANGATLNAPVRWESSSALLTIDTAGMARVVGALSADVNVTVTAKAGPGGTVSTAATATLRWQMPLSVWPDTNVLWLGTTRRLVARVPYTGSAGPEIRVVDTVGASGWISGDTSIATVDGSGFVTARAPGRTWIRAQYTGSPGRAWVQVSAPPASPLRFVSVSGGGVGLGFARTEAFVERGCGLTASGEVHCWGYGVSLDGWADACEGVGRDGALYQLRRYRCTEVPVRLATPETFSFMTNSSVGCGINAARRVFCWGSNRYGEMGIGSTDTLQRGVTPITSTDEFRSVHITEVTSFRQGPNVTACGVRVDDAVVCWGWGYTPTPTRVDGFSFSSLAQAGRCGVATDGTMRCLPHESGITLVPGPAVEVATQPWASAENCARRADGSVDCVRYSGTVTRMNLGEPATMISTYWLGAGDHPGVCAITASGQLRCGLATTAEVFPGRRWKSFFGNCGIATDDKTYCWRQGVIREVPGQ